MEIGLRQIRVGESWAGNWQRGELGEEGEREMLKLGEKRKREREERRCGGVYSAIWWLVFFPSHRAGRSIIGRCIILDNEIEVDRIRE